MLIVFALLFLISTPSILYLTILNETKSMVLQSRNLLKSQRYFLEHKDGPLQWLNKIK